MVSLTSAIETVRTLEALVTVPHYIILGSSKDRVIYLSDEGGTLCLWCLDPRTGDKSRITTEDVAGGAQPRRATNDLYYIRDSAKGAEQHKIYRSSATEPRETPLEIPPMRLTGLSSYEGVVALSASTKDSAGLFTYRSGAVERRATIDGLTGLADSNGRFLAGSGPLVGNPRSSELFFFHLDSGKMEVFTPKEGSVNKGPSLRGSKALFESNMTGSNILYVHDIETGETGPAPAGSGDLSASGAAEYLMFDWTEDGRVYCIAKRDGETKAFVDGKRVDTPAGFLAGMALHGSKAYLAHSTFVQPYKVWEVDTTSGASRIVIDNPLPSFLKEKFGRSRMIRYKSSDGLEIPALVVDDGSGVKRRTVAYIHGGPWAEEANSWSVLPASLVAFGYNIIAPNYRGSTGYGEEFRILDIGDPMGMDFQDMVSATKWAKENIATDVAIAGYSYGGYSTLFGLGKEPELWACGVAGAPVADMKAMYDMSDATFRSFIDVLFDRKTELLAERSPITYVKSVNKPLCIITTQNDSRTPMKPVLQYAMELLANKAKFEIHSVPDMGHAIRTTKDAMDVIYPMISFLQREFPAAPKQTAA